jgi:class 3 adenylate cyclase
MSLGKASSLVTMPPPVAPLPDGTVTFLFTDIEGSTQLWESEPEMMKTQLAVHDRIVGDAIAMNHGVVFKTGGDSFCASFARPDNGLQAALEAQAAIRETVWETVRPIRVRMGIHTGTAQIRGNDYFGPTLNRAARIMSAGHGGQVLMSSSTQRLIVDELPQDVELVSLGIQHLKDLDRPEEIFQAAPSGIEQSFPPLQTATTRDGSLASLVSEAYRKKKWHDVFTLLSDIESDHPLTAEQNEMMGFAMWWLGDHANIVDRFEETYAAYLTEGNPQGAATAALQLAELLSHNLAREVAAGWARRAEELLKDDQDSIARGHLTRWQSIRAFDDDHDIDRAIELTERVGEIGRANSDGNLEVLALQDRGRFLIASGDTSEGMALMDQAMIGAVAGDVDPIVVGRSYCNMLAVCEQTGDVKKAAEWSVAAEKWCSESESSPYPGVCRIFKAEVMWKNGDWVGAETEVLRASTELGIYTYISGEAWYQYGEMRLRAGDPTGAENAFEEALTRGREPVPGYALLLAQQGDTASALEMVEHALTGDLTKLDRARFLPALIELALNSGDLDKATAAADELEVIGRLAKSDLFGAESMRGHGLIALENGDTENGIRILRDAVRTFTKLGLPFEAARARTDLGRALINKGSPALAIMELRSAKSEFERLGSTGDAVAVKALLESAHP